MYAVNKITEAPIPSAQINEVHVELSRGASIEIRQVPLKEATRFPLLSWEGKEEEFLLSNAALSTGRNVLYVCQNTELYEHDRPWDGSPESRPHATLTLLAPENGKTGIKRLTVYSGPRTVAEGIDLPGKLAGRAGNIILRNLQAQSITARAVAMGAVRLDHVRADVLRARTRYGFITVTGGGTSAAYDDSDEHGKPGWELNAYSGWIVYGEEAPSDIITAKSVLGKVLTSESERAASA